MKTAIIGASGFIGSRLVEAFYLGDGPAVVAVSRNPERVALSTRFALDLRIADALDEEALGAALSGCAAAIHAVRGKPADLKRQAVLLCRAAAKEGVRRLVYIGSAEVHGANPAPGTTEKTRTDARALDIAASAQLAAERMFFAECRRADITAFALRPGFVFGPRSPFVAELAQELRTGRAWLLGSGDTVCNSMYVDNLVAAVRLCLRAKTGAGQPYLVGDSETVTWRDFYHAIAHELDCSARHIRQVEAPPPGADPARTRHQQSHSKPSFAAAARVLGYAPVVPFAEAIKRTCSWWRFAQGEFTVAA